MTVEVRDSATGQVLSRRSLRYGFDYDFDYIQGLIILTTPAGLFDLQRLA